VIVEKEGKLYVLEASNVVKLTPLKAWIAEVKKANWQNAHEIKAQYKSASILKNRRVVFNIKGNDHRLVVAIAFQFGAVYVKFIGTHTEYDRINANDVELN